MSIDFYLKYFVIEFNIKISGGFSTPNLPPRGHGLDYETVDVRIKMISTGKILLARVRFSERITVKKNKLLRRTNL